MHVLGHCAIDKTGANGHNLQYGKFQLNIRKKGSVMTGVKQGKGLLRKAEEMPSLEVLKTQLYLRQSNLI